MLEESTSPRAEHQHAQPVNTVWWKFWCWVAEINNSPDTRRNENGWEEGKGWGGNAGEVRPAVVRRRPAAVAPTGGALGVPKGAAVAEPVVVGFEAPHTVLLLLILEAFPILEKAVPPSPPSLIGCCRRIALGPRWERAAGRYENTYHA